MSLTERLLGKAQTRLMQSLDYGTFSRGYIVSDTPSSMLARHEAFRIENFVGTSLDVVGMAAAVGMTIYVCEQLGLPIESRHYRPSLPDSGIYCMNRATAATLCWDRGDLSRYLGPILVIGLRSSCYRQALARCLHWEMDDSLSLSTPTEVIPLAESYMLSCCKPWCFDLIRVLLQAGANPMIRVRSIPTYGDSSPKSFWHS